MTFTGLGQADLASGLKRRIIGIFGAFASGANGANRSPVARLRGTAFPANLP
jgi:hypothetical protein